MRLCKQDCFCGPRLGSHHRCKWFRKFMVQAKSGREGRTEIKILEIEFRVQQAPTTGLYRAEH